jgi:aarF domain-containing kinase
MYNLFTSNGGLYIKIGTSFHFPPSQPHLNQVSGQAMGANPAVLPLPFQVKFSKLFDDAPQIPMSVVHSVFLSEFGRSPSGPDGVFEYFDDNAIASASIAQVHRAMLWEKDERGRDQWVAVKVQKPDVGKQVEWDLAAYKFVSWMFEHWLFDLPLYFVCGQSILFQGFAFVRATHALGSRICI